ncbi:MAG: PAS domain-containing methyl-accepting chemotaxis protein [Terracidiphilus sp.]|jgi:aerotaxis receptor
MARDVHVTNVETVLPENAFIYSQTNLKGIIVEANDTFASISGYAVEEMIGKPHNLVRHPDMPKEAFADLWHSLKQGRPWQGIVKNRRKDGGYYWVLANVSPVREGGRIVGYQSLRHRPSREQIAAASKAYQRINAGDTSLKIEAGRAVLLRKSKMQIFTKVQFQLVLSSLLALLASGIGLVDYAGGKAYPQLQTAATTVFALSGLAAFLTLFRFLPNLARDLKRIESYLDELLTSGNLKIRFESDRQDCLGSIGRKLGLLVSWVQSTVQCIGEAVNQVQGVAEDVLKNVAEIQQAASAQNMDSASVAAAATELGLTIQEVSQHLQNTDSTVIETGKRASEGASISQNATDQIHNLAKTIQDATSSVEALGTSSAQVGEIAGVIREIADQTNLLALNASIEAARAGEAGRGFAVVANEVRSLADRTTKATAKIDALIVKIKSDSERAITGMHTGSTQVTNGLTMVQGAQNALNGINQLMTDAVRMVSEIASASSQQTEAMNDISSNISHVASMTEQTVGVVQHTSGRIKFLAPMVDRVKKAVAQYEV